jgi:hypothetical protein
VNERYITPHPLPTSYERELLTILIEECAEVQQAATKLLRFGRDDVEPGKDKTNGFRLGMEIGDLYVMIEMALKAGIIRDTTIIEGSYRKRERIAKYMQTEVKD